MEGAEQLANDHWDYIAELLKIHQETQRTIEMARFHYLQAFKHGYKHGVEDMKEENAESRV